MTDTDTDTDTDYELYFAHQATLQIFGRDLDFSEISRELGLKPTRTVRRGDRSGLGRPYPRDGWFYQAPVAEEEGLGHHIDSLRHAVVGRVSYLKALKSHCEVRIFLGYRTNCETGGLEVPAESLRLFEELDVPFELSVIVA